MIQVSTVPTMPHAGGNRPNWGRLPDRAKVERKTLKLALMVGGVAFGFLGMFSSIIPGLHLISTPILMGVTHLVDRIKNAVGATDELTFRAQFYTKEIHATLRAMNIDFKAGKYASVEDLKKAAQFNPALQKIYQAPIKHKDKENRFSFFTNGAIAAAGTLIPGGAVVAGVVNATDAVKLGAETVKVGAEASKLAGLAKNGLQVAKLVGRDVVAGLGGGAIAKAVSKDVVDAHELVEAMTLAAQDAYAKGVPIEEVVKPEMLFTLRIAQDAALEGEIKSIYGKSFHKMNEAEQANVMNNERYDALKNSAVMDVQQIRNIPNAAAQVDAVRGLGGTVADLSKTRQYAVGTPAVGKFTSRVLSERAAANDPSMNAPNVRNISHAERIRAQRAMAAAQVGVKA